MTQKLTDAVEIFEQAIAAADVANYLAFLDQGGGADLDYKAYLAQEIAESARLALVKIEASSQAARS